MRLAQVTQAGELVHAAGLHIVVVDVFQRGAKDERPAVGGRAAVLAAELAAQLGDQKEGVECEERGIAVGTGGRLLEQAFADEIQPRMAGGGDVQIAAQQHAEALLLPLGQARMMAERIRVDKQVVPAASAAGRGAGGVRHKARNQKDVPRGKGHGDVVFKAEEAAVGEAVADFQAVVKVEAVAEHVGDAPFLAGKAQERLVGFKLIDAVFDDVFGRTRHAVSSCFLPFAGPFYP